MTTGVFNDEMWAAVCRRQPLKKVDDQLVVGDRDRLTEAVYAAAVETGALAGTA